MTKDRPKKERDKRESLRVDFKRVSFDNKFFLYPTPVIKNQKYLIEVGKSWADFFIFCLLHGFIPSPDGNLSYLREDRIHTDGKTMIYQVSIADLKFDLLKSTLSKLAKAKLEFLKIALLKLRDDKLHFDKFKLFKYLI